MQTPVCNTIETLVSDNKEHLFFLRKFYQTLLLESDLDALRRYYYYVTNTICDQQLIAIYESQTLRVRRVGKYYVSRTSSIKLFPLVVPLLMLGRYPSMTTTIKNFIICLIFEHFSGCPTVLVWPTFQLQFPSMNATMGNLQQNTHSLHWF